MIKAKAASTVLLSAVADVNPTSIDASWGYDHALYVDISSVGEGMLSDIPSYIAIELLPSRAKRTILPGDTILSMVRPARRSIMYIRNSANDWLVSTGFAVLRPRRSLIDSRFLYYCVYDRRFTVQLIMKEKGAAYPAVLPEDIMNGNITLPTLPEQRRIAHILGALDDKIENNRKTAKTLEAMAQAIFKSWFVDFDPVRAKASGESTESICNRLKMTPEILAQFPDGFEDSELGKIPRGWKVGAIFEIAKVIYGAPFASKAFNSHGVGIPLLRIRDLKSESPGIWTDEQHPNGYLVRPGDIVVGMDGEFRAYIWGGVECWLNQRLCSFQSLGAICPAYILNLIVPLLAEVESTETATTVIHIGKSDIDKFRALLPDQTILQYFCTSTQPLYNLAVSTKQTNHKLSRTRDTLLPKLISGELRVDEAEALVEETTG